MTKAFDATSRASDDPLDTERLARELVKAAEQSAPHGYDPDAADHLSDHLTFIEQTHHERDEERAFFDAKRRRGSGIGLDENSEMIGNDGRIDATDSTNPSGTSTG